MPKLMRKNDWIQTVANVGVADRIWSENISTDDGHFSMPTKAIMTTPVRKSARDFIGWGLQFDSTRCTTDEWMKKLREGEED